MRPADPEQLDDDWFDPIDPEELGDHELAEFAEEDCGRWNNGRLMPVYWCLKAGSEECDWECPLRDGARALRK